MTEITQADRDAAAALSDEVNPCACEMCKGTMQEAFARHRLEERAAIVAWLRGDDPYPDGHDIADAIEAGEYLK